MKRLIAKVNALMEDQREAAETCNGLALAGLLIAKHRRDWDLITLIPPDHCPAP